MTDNAWFVSEAAVVQVPYARGEWSDQGASSLRIDCGSCRARGPACTDCVVSVLLGVEGEHPWAPGDVEAEAWLTDDEQAAVAALADSGLVPPLRLVGD